MAEGEWSKLSRAAEDRLVHGVQTRLTPNQTGIPMKAKSETKPAPQHLTAASQALFCRIRDDYALQDDDAALTLLRLACEAVDRCTEARERIKADGTYLPDRFGQLRPHPAVNVERDSRLSAARLLRELGLSPDEASLNENRPPRPGKR
jgi:P27 family predicted phage terminase small subunit